MIYDFCQIVQGGVSPSFQTFQRIGFLNAGGFGAGTAFLIGGGGPFFISKSLSYLNNYTWILRPQNLQILPLIFNSLAMTNYILSTLINIITAIDSEIQPQSIDCIRTAIDTIQECLNTEPKKVGNYYDQIYSTFELAMAPGQTECTFLQLAFLADSLAKIIAMMPKLLKNHKNRFTSLISKYLELMSRIKFDVPESWLSPPQGHNQDQELAADDDTMVIKQMMKTFDSIANALGYSFFIEQFKSIGVEWFNKNDQDWRFKHAALNAMSQLGEDSDDISQIDVFVQCALSCANHPHPKIRFAMLQTIGQISDDMNPIFQKHYFTPVMPVLLQMMKDPCPRVASHAFACTTNFIEDFEEIAKISGFLNEIMQNVEYNCQYGCSLSKENAMATLGTIGGIENLLDSNSLAKAMQIVSKVLVNHLDPIYQQLVSQCFQTSSIILSSQKKTLVEPYLNQHIQLLIDKRDFLMNEYFLGAWTRYCLLMKQPFTDMSHIMTDFLNKVQFSLINQEDQAAISAVNSLIETCRCFKTGLKPFTNSILNLLKESTNNLEYGNNIRGKCIQALEEVIINLKPQGPDPEWETQAKEILQFLFSDIEKSCTSENQVNLFDDLQTCIVSISNLISAMKGLFSDQQIWSLAQAIMSMIKTIEIPLSQQESDLAQFDALKGDQNDDMDLEADRVVLVEQIQKIQDAMLEIPDLYKTLFNISSKEVKFSILESLFPHIQMSFLANTDFRIRYGLYYIDDILQVFEYEQMAAKWNDFYNVLAKYAKSTSDWIRNSAVYGLGVLFQKSPINLITESDIIGWLQVLWQSLMVNISAAPDEKKKKKNSIFAFSRDNSIAALGKLLNRFYLKFPALLNKQIFQKWLECLPLNADKAQGNIQQNYLIELVQKNPELIIGNANDLKLLLQVYAKFTQYRKKTEDLPEIKKTKESLSIIKNWPLFIESSVYLHQSLSTSHITTLTKLLSDQ